jgi:two-component system, chemotaxis family, response regulator PixG
MVEAALRPLTTPYSIPRISLSGGDFSAREPIPLANFSAVKQADFFGKLREREFSGRLYLSDQQGIESVFYFYLGRLVYATGGTHPVRRWQRSLSAHCPELLQDPETLRRGLMGVDPDSSIAWEYQVLSEWARQQKLTLEQINGIVRSHVEELLFDLTRADRVSYYRQADRVDGFIPLTVINPEQAIAKVWQQYQEWQSARLADRFPDQAPIIKNLCELANQVSPFTCQLFTDRFNGQHSLRDLAVHLKQDLVVLTRSLSRYVQMGLIELVAIEDFPAPISILQSSNFPESIPLTIAYGDANRLACQRFAEKIQAAKHRCTVVQDGLQAISLFVECKPDVICLGSQLLHMDGYTICKALRQIPSFQATPIWMFSDSVGLSDRIRAKISGASEIVEKYPSSRKLQQLLDKYFV